jgi:hypothetical protein
MIITARTLNGFELRGTDGGEGTVGELYFDDRGWTLRYLIVDARNRLPGRKVRVSPRWMTSVSRSDAKVYVDLLRETVKSSPEFSDAASAR